GQPLPAMARRRPAAPGRSAAGLRCSVDRGRGGFGRRAGDRHKGGGRMRQEPPPTSPGYGPATEDTPQGYEAAPAFLVLGEALIDIVDDADGNHTEHVGGSPANVALGLARLSNPVELTTHIGPDARGAQIRQALETDAVDFTAGSTRA